MGGRSERHGVHGWYWHVEIESKRRNSMDKPKANQHVSGRKLSINGCFDWAEIYLVDCCYGETVKLF